MATYTRPLALIIALLLFSCGDSSSDTSDIKTVNIGAFKQECYSFFYSFCNIAVPSDGSETSLLTQGIQGFDYEWGYEYTVRFRDTPLANPPADSSNFSRDLVEVARKDPVALGTEFKLALRASDPSSQQDSGFITQLPSGLYTVYSSVLIECNSSQVCNELDDVIENDLAFIGTFTFRPELGLPISLQSIECTEANRRYLIQCDKTIGLVTSTRIVDKFSQDATEFSIGETIGVEMVLNNSGDDDIILDDNLCQNLSVSVSFVAPDRDIPLWNFLSSGIQCTVTGSENAVLSPDASSILSIQWDQTDSSGFPQGASGNFKIKSWFLNQPEHQSIVMIR